MAIKNLLVRENLDREFISIRINKKGEKIIQSLLMHLKKNIPSLEEFKYSSNEILIEMPVKYGTPLTYSIPYLCEVINKFNFDSDVLAIVESIIIDSFGKGYKRVICKRWKAA